MYPPASLPSPWSRDSFFSLSNLFRPIQTHIRRLNQPTIYTSNSSPSLPLPRFHLRHRATTTIHHVELIYTKIFVGLRFRYRDTRYVYIHIYIYIFEFLKIDRVFSFIRIFRIEMLRKFIFICSSNALITKHTLYGSNGNNSVVEKVATRSFRR